MDGIRFAHGTRRLDADPYAPRPMGLRRYRELLRVPGLRPLMLAVSLGRLPYGMNILAEILLLRAAGFDYAVVGVVTAASGLSVGLAAPVMGRVIDRVGQTKVLLTAAVYTAISGTAFVIAVLEGAGATPVTILAFLMGLIVPPVSPSLRALLPGIVGRERLDTAFALDALLLELVFITGPLLAAGLATAISPEVAFLTGVALQAAGGLGVAASPHSRAWRPAPREPGARAQGRALDRWDPRARAHPRADRGLARGARDHHRRLRRGARHARRRRLAVHAVERGVARRRPLVRRPRVARAAAHPLPRSSPAC